MTNSHNKIMAGNQKESTSNSRGQGQGIATERFFKHQGRNHRSPSTKYFSSSSKPSPNTNVQTPQNGTSRGKNEGSNRTASQFIATSPSGAKQPFCSSPPNFSHFAGSKCYDAPAPTALPLPPRHWTSSSFPSTSCATEAAASTHTQRYDVFTHNLKSILNVKA